MLALVIFCKGPFSDKNVQYKKVKQTSWIKNPIFTKILFVSLAVDNKILRSFYSTELMHGRLELVLSETIKESTSPEKLFAYIFDNVGDLSTILLTHFLPTIHTNEINLLLTCGCKQRIFTDRLWLRNLRKKEVGKSIKLVRDPNP